MNKTTLIAATALVIVGVAGAQIVKNQNNQEQNSVPALQEAARPAVQDSQLESTSQESSLDAAQQPVASRYTEYSPELLSQAQAEGKRVVLFFHADWCPTCIAAAKDFTENYDQIPEDTIILKADYDTETELKKKYAVVTQDTFIQLGADDSVVARWNGGGEGIRSLLTYSK